MQRVLRLVLVAALYAAAPAAALVIASEDGSGNLSAPSADPGFANVGTRGGLSAVYVGEGWVITAAHAGVGEVVLGGEAFAPQAGSERFLVNPDGSAADLLAFRLLDPPQLPSLRLARRSPVAGDALLLAGHGRNRGGAVDWYGRRGWAWGADQSLRWGTNQVAGGDADVATGAHTTRSFFSDFSLEGGTQHEAQAATGDSGGAVFAREGEQWVLAGVMIAILAPFQPAQWALEGNLTYAADLAFYRAQLEDAGLSQPAGELEIGARVIRFGFVGVGRSRSGGLPVANPGDGPLHIHAVELRGSPHFAIQPGEPHSLVLDPGEASRLPVVFAPSRRGWHVAWLVLHSDDPERPLARVPLVGFAWGRGPWRALR